jgi:hypothetical protein
MNRARVSARTSLVKQLGAVARFPTNDTTIGDESRAKRFPLSSFGPACASREVQNKLK